MRPQEIARKMVTVKEDRVGWYLSLANKVTNPTCWRVIGWKDAKEAREMARYIRRVVVDGILEARKGSRRPSRSAARRAT